MLNRIKSKLSLKVNFKRYHEYKSCIIDLTENGVVNLMDNYEQHGSVTRLEHSLFVSYTSYWLCKFLHFDFCSAARGGLLHDLFLYDWHKTKSDKGMHGFAHPYVALETANKHFKLNKLEQDIIVKHMWPLTIKLPRYKEAYIVSFVDKYCATIEMLRYIKVKIATCFDPTLARDLGSTAG